MHTYISMFVYIFFSEFIMTHLQPNTSGFFLAFPPSMLVFSPTVGNLPINIIDTFTHLLNIINCPATSAFFSLCHPHASPSPHVLALLCLTAGREEK